MYFFSFSCKTLVYPGLLTLSGQSLKFGGSGQEHTLFKPMKAEMFRMVASDANLSTHMMQLQNLAMHTAGIPQEMAFEE